jgi:MFS family permease
MIALGSVHRVALIAPGVFLLALVTEMYRPAMQAAVSDLVPPAERVRAFGLIYWVINVGFAIGLTLGGLVASHSYHLLFLGDGITTLAFAGLIAAGVPETRPTHGMPASGAASRSLLAEFFAPYRDRTFALFLVLGFLFAVLFMQNATTFAVDMTAHGVSKAVYGRVLALNGILIAFIQPFLGPYLAKRDPSRSMAIGSAIVGAGFGLNALARSAWPYAAGVVVWTLGEMAVLPLANARVAALSPTALRGRYQGAYSLAFGLGVCAAPALGMLVLDRLGSVALWTSCFAIGVIVAAGHRSLGRRLARAPARQDAEAAAAADRAS